MKPYKRRNDDINEEKTKILFPKKIKKSPTRKKNYFSYNEITDKVKIIRLEYNTQYLIQYLNSDFKVSTRDFYEKKN